MADSTQSPLLEIAKASALGASEALSRWIGGEAKVSACEAGLYDLTEATGLLGPEDDLVAACAMDIEGGISGKLCLVFEDRAGLALVDVLLGQPAGVARTWGDLERSAVMETANIVGCAFLNSLAGFATQTKSSAGLESITPSPPSFRHEFAASLLEFALMDQAMTGDRPLVVVVRFAMEGADAAWSLLLVPDGSSAVRLKHSLSATDASQ